MALAEVRRLHDAPPLNDIAARLRHLADQIERGEVGPEAAYVVLVDSVEFEPAFYGFGRMSDRHGLAGLFMHVAQLALTDAEPD